MLLHNRVIVSRWTQRLIYLPQISIQVLLTTPEGNKAAQLQNLRTIRRASNLGTRCQH